MSAKITKDQFIKRSIDKHGNKYDYSLVSYRDTKTKVTIVCSIHGEFNQTPEKHMSGQKCPKCSGTVQISTSEYIHKVSNVHNGKYSYDKTIYNGAHNKITVTCMEHGAFQITANHHANGKGCRQCGQERRKEQITYTTQEFIDKATIVHAGKYLYHAVVYENSKNHVAIHCPIHGIFLQTPKCHLRGRGCGECNLESRKLTLFEFIERSKEVHGNVYDYSMVNYKNNSTKVNIICHQHGIFSQTPEKHMIGNSCPKCSSSFSKPATKWLDSLNLEHMKREYRIPSTNYKVDGYDPETNTVYEFHGDYWHGNPTVFERNAINRNIKKTFGELYENTLVREQKLKDMGYNLVVMWEHDWKKLNKY